MKLFYLPLFLYLLAYLPSSAQVNRREERKSVPYRNSYQRMVSSACAQHSFEIKEGYIWAWGANEAGQIGDNTTLQRKQSVRLATDNNWVVVSAGGKHSAAIKANGTLYTWGNNTQGQLGLGNTNNQKTPTQVGADSNWISVACGNNFTLALKADGTLSLRST